MEILALHLQSYINYAVIRNIELTHLYSSFPNVRPEYVKVDSMIPVEDFYSVLDYIDKKLNDGHLGLRAGRFLNLNALGLIYQISLEATTIEEGLDYLKNFISASFPLISCQTFIEKDNFVIDLAIEGFNKELNRLLLETVLTIVSRELEMMSTNAVKIHMTSPFFEETYPTDFSFGERYQVHFHDVKIKASIRNHSNKHLYYLLPQYLRMIEELKSNNSFVNKVKITSLSMATPALPDLDEIAYSFNLTPRTLQRTLEKEGHTFRKITEELNKKLSILLLNHQKYTVKDVGYLLGFSEPAAFTRSFKKWYGINPAVARKQGNMLNNKDNSVLMK